MKTIITFSVALFLIACTPIRPFSVAPGAAEPAVIDGKPYIRDSWAITNETGQPLPIAAVLVEYLATDGTVIHTHTLTCPNAIEPYGKKLAHPAQVYSVTEKQISAMASSRVTVTTGKCP